MILAAHYRPTLPLAVVLLACVSGAALAQTNDVTIENLSFPGKGQAKTTIKRIDVAGSNLTKDELSKLFSGAASKDEVLALVKKFKADKVSIPEVVFSDTDGSITFRDFQAKGINEGKIASAILKGADGKGKAKGGDFTIKSGQAEMQGLGFASLLQAVSSGEFGDGGAQVAKLTYAGFEMSGPDEDTKPTAPGGNLYKISLASFTAEGTYDGDIPVKGVGEAKNLVIEPPKMSKFGQAISSFGYDKINTGFKFAGTYDKAKKTYNFDDFSITGANAGSIGLKLLLANVDPVVFTGKKDAKLAGWMGAALSNISLRYDNNGLFEKAVDFLAKQQKKAPDALKKEWSSMVTQMLPLIMGGDPASLKLADAAAKFIANPKNITISMKSKGEPLKFTDFAGVKDPMAVLKMIDLDASAGQ